MRRFAAFVADSATADAQAANVARLEALEKVKAVDRSVLDAPTLAEVAERLPDLHVAITAAESVWAARHARVTQTLEADGPGVSAASAGSEPGWCLRRQDRLAARGRQTLRDSADPAVRLALTRELAELELDNACPAIALQLSVLSRTARCMTT